jgi:HAD superfamily phosphatase (TIGR01681 family)
MKKVYICDFDGVLGIPYSIPEKHYEQIPGLIKELSKDHILCVASYNPRAEVAIQDWGLDKYFACMRYGANHTWKEYYSESYRAEMSKSQQIINMLNQEIKELNCNIDDITFFDDDQNNINAVKDKLPHINTVLINNKYGLRMEDIPVSLY